MVNYSFFYLTHVSNSFLAQLSALEYRVLVFSYPCLHIKLELAGRRGGPRARQAVVGLGRGGRESIPHGAVELRGRGPGRRRKRRPKRGFAVLNVAPFLKELNCALRLLDLNSIFHVHRAHSIIS